MADYQVTNYGLCGECRHHKYICDRDHSYAGFTTEEWICDNPKSVSNGKLMPYTGSCTCWEQREMTREDAIYEIKQLAVLSTKRNIDRITEALNMAIEALQDEVWKDTPKELDDE